MYALCVSGAVNTQGFVWKFFMCYIKKFIHSLRVVCISLREYYVVVSYTLMRCSLQLTPQSLSMLECE